MGKKKKRTLLRALLIASGIIIISLSYQARELYKKVYSPNVVLEQNHDGFIYIKTGWNFEQVKNMLYEQGVIHNRSDFEWVSEKKSYSMRVKPGRYLLKPGMNNNELVNLLRSGRQTPVKITFNNIRYKETLAERIGRQLEADSLEILELLNSPSYLEEFGIKPEQVLSIIIPNTYEFFWNTSARQFLDRMHREYERFWNESRRKKAAAIPLSPIEVSVLASIVESETTKREEMSRIAGVYINRLRKGMLLQADPTVRYAVNDPSLRRVLYRHLEIDSPYNTYKYAGLPPGPICMPSPITIDKVLDYEKHDYLFFCAKDDFSGFHVFSKTHAQHEQYAARYRRALNARNIR